MRRHPAMAVLALVAVLASPHVAADPAPVDPPTHGTLPDSGHVRLVSGPGTLFVPSINHIFDLPEMTHILTPPAWSVLDTEMKRLQDAELRLKTENDYMRKRVSGWRPSWQVIGIATLSGIATGIYLGRKL